MFIPLMVFPSLVVSCIIVSVNVTHFAIVKESINYWHLKGVKSQLKEIYMGDMFSSILRFPESKNI